MWPPTSHGLIWRGIALAGTPAIAAPGASYAVDFSRRLKNDELLPPAVADSPTGKIDEHREEESSELRRQAVHGSGAAPHVGGGRGFAQSSGKRNCSCPELFGNVVAGGGGGGALPNKPKIEVASTFRTRV